MDHVAKEMRKILRNLSQANKLSEAAEIVANYTCMDVDPAHKEAKRMRDAVYNHPVYVRCENYVTEQLAKGQ